MSAPLTAVQCDLHDYLLDAGDRITPRIQTGGRISVAQRLGIYHNAYRVRLADTLRDSYEKTWTYLGDATFDACALAYIESHPPTHRSLRDYGAALPEWLTIRFPDDPDIAELALMDWQLRQTFDGPDASVMGLDALTTLTPGDWETLGFQLVPTLKLWPLHFNTPAIWGALDQGLAPPGACSLDAPAWLCVWRQGWQPHFRTLDATEFRALDAVRRGARFAAVCQQLAETGEAAQSLIARYLHVWLTDGLIACVKHVPGECSA